VPTRFPRPSPGFTLIEIMIVVVIIGLLVALAVPAINRVRASAQDKAVLNNVRSLASAADQYMTETGASTLSRGDLVGSDKYVRVFGAVANEAYPVAFTQGVPLTVTGIAGVRTITYGL